MNAADDLNGDASPGHGVTRSLVDGVPVFWVPDSSKSVGALMFRIGRADETVVQAGLTHLIEHLALNGLGAKQPYAFNGMVESLRVSFQAAGTPEQLVAFFAHVCAALRNLPLERVPMEARVLRTEAAGRVKRLMHLVYRWRFGLRGQGVTDCRELSLEQPAPTAISSWAAENFTTGNASAWFSCGIPAGLSFDLPTGPRRAVKPQETIPILKLPAWREGLSGSVALSLVGTRTDWLYVPVHIAAQRMEQLLRFDKGLSYGAVVEYDVTGPDLAHTLLSISTLDKHATAVQEDMLRELRELAATGPTEAELHALASELERESSEPDSVFGVLDKCAYNELLGFPSKTAAELAAELRSTPRATFAKRLKEGLRSALLLVPSGTEVKDRAFPYYGIPCAPPPSNGRSYSWSKARFPWSRDWRNLVVADTGIAIVFPSGGYATLLYSELAVAVVGPDGSIELVDHDGASIQVVPSAWRDGAGAIRRILSSIPSDRVVHLAE